MYRVALSVALSLLLSACSLGFSQPFSFGFADSGSAVPVQTASVRSSSNAGLDSDGAQSAPQPQKSGNQRQAKLDDKAPKGSFDRAPSGALANRDYALTKLDAEQARDLINAYRHNKGLKPLTLNAELTAAAKEHSRDLAKWDRISHYGSDGSNPWDRVKRTGYGARVAAENVGTGQASIEEVLKGWQASPGHNKNLLLADVDNMGIALVQDPKTEFKTFWTLVLASRL
jgi:uncharacterized protein YkwD